MSNSPWEQLAAVSLSAKTGRRPDEYLQAWREGRRLDRPVWRSEIPAAVRRAVEAEGPCVYCGAEASVVDHIKPWARGGTHDLSNLVPSCASCNFSKSDRLLTEWDAARVQRAIGVSVKVAAVYAGLVEAAPPQ
ncbi:HNH endonuclease [Streptomyces sp. NPDC008240]|uniref:HNH endonuclease n=1 Tax=Streptomyces sp. NPDC008240 TaxID=3364822 RepID=UPI0036E05DB5